MLTTKELNRKVAGIRRSTAAIRENIHVVLTNLAGHAYEHGDVSVAIKLLNATKGVDKVAIVKYLRENCFTLVNSDGSVKLNKKARNEADFVDGEAVVAHLTSEVQPWYEDAVTTEQAAKVADPAKSLAALVKSIGKADGIKFDPAAMRAEFENVMAAAQIKDADCNRKVSDIAEGRAIEDRYAA